MNIKDSDTCNIVSTGIIDHSSYLYSFSHFSPPYPPSKIHSSLRELVEVKSGHFNLCVVPKTSVVTSTPPSPIQIPFVAQDSSLALLDILAPFIELPNAVIEGISKDIHLLSNDRLNTPVIPPPLEILLHESHAFSFEHQLGLPTLSYIKRFHLPCLLPLFFQIGATLVSLVTHEFYHLGGVVES